MTPPVDTLKAARATEVEVPARERVTPELQRPVLSAVQGPERARVNQPGLSAQVVIVTRDSQIDLEASLGAIRQAAAEARAGLLFVDLGSRDSTRSYVAQNAPGAQGIWLGEHDGLADALEAAAAWTDAEVLVVVNPALRPASADSLTGLLAHLQQHPYAAAAAPALRGPEGNLLSTVRPEPSLNGFSRVEYVLGDAFAIRRSDVEKVTQTRRRHPSASEELELCLALRRRGREIHYVTAVEWIDAGGTVAARAGDALARVERRAARIRRRSTRPGRAGALLGRAFDVLAAGVLITVLSPILLAIALAIRLDSRGPALFRQRRVGRDAKEFEMVKFRTMQHAADPQLHEEFVRDMILNRKRGAGEAAIFKLHPDPRITRLGRILRRTSLDELPQLFNILRGDMTFVGFRPPIPYEVATYPEWYFRRFDSKPGLTGLWQVSGRNECSYEEMVCLDIEYANRRSWLFDLKVLIRTIGVVITGRGAY